MRIPARTQAPLPRLTILLVLLGCAPRHLPQALGETAPSPCLVRDTTAAAPDTIRVIDGSGRSIGEPLSGTDCQGNAYQIVTAPTLVILTPPGGADLRDVLEGRVASGTPRPDVVITRDPDLLDFARRRAGYLVHALPWDLTYVLAAAVTDSGASLPAGDERDALARNAVTGDVRGAVEPFGWLTEPRCAAGIATRARSPRAVVGYPAHDAIARQLAERIVSLASGGSRPGWIPAALVRSTAGGARVAPIPEDSLTQALTSGSAAAVVVPIARDLTAPCGRRGDMPVPRGAIPLVDARNHIIVRRGSGAALVIDATGSVHFMKRGNQ